ncbi:MAG: DUF4410 domain-containing protein [bacterium]|nr:DUF4410 domain-containing protein [bacterium]
MTLRPTNRLLLLCLPLAFTALGCGRVTTARYLKGSFQLHHDPAIRLDYVYMAPDAARLRGGSLLVYVEDPTHTIDLENAKISKKMKAKWPEWWLDYERTLADLVWQSAVFRDVAAASDTSLMAHPDYILKAAVTEWNEGSGLLRGILGFGFGSTRMQWEAALIDTRTNQTLFALADARIHPGGPSLMGFGVKVYNGPALIAEDLFNAAKDMDAALRGIAGVSEAPRPSWATRPLYRPNSIPGPAGSAFAPVGANGPPTPAGETPTMQAVPRVPRAIVPRPDAPAAAPGAPR